MNFLTSTLGRALLSLPFFAFGIGHFANAGAMAGMVPSYVPGGVLWVYLTGAALLSRFYAADPSRFAWRNPPYEYEHDKMPIDILAGSSDLRRQVETGVDPRAIAASWTDAVDRFLSVMAGNLPGYEDATRALYAGEFAKVESLAARWPGDVGPHVRRLVAEAARLQKAAPSPR